MDFKIIISGRLAFKNERSIKKSNGGVHAQVRNIVQIFPPI